MCACGCDTTRNITKRQLNLLRQQTLFFAYPMAGLMMKRIGCGTKPVRQWAMPNVKWTAYAPPILSLRRPFWIERWDQGIAGIEQILVSDASSPG